MPLAIITETAQQQIVREIAAVIRQELGTSLPDHLAPVLTALSEFRATMQHGSRTSNGQTHVLHPSFAEHVREASTSESSQGHADPRKQATPQLTKQKSKRLDQVSQEGNGACAKASHQTEDVPDLEQMQLQQPQTAMGWPMALLSSRQQREGYQLLKTKGDEPEIHSARDLHGVIVDAPWMQEQQIMDPEAAVRLEREMGELEEQKDANEQTIVNLEMLHKNRAAPYRREVGRITERISEVQEELGAARQPYVPKAAPPGPAIFKFVDGYPFFAVSNVVLMINLMCFALTLHFNLRGGVWHILDELFLAWYIIELLMKSVYHQRCLFFGALSVVWWNWLDLCIVVSGILDEWLLPLVNSIHGMGLSFDSSGLRLLRALRLISVFRFLKIVKAFLTSNLAWTDGVLFQSFMSIVIAGNSAIMSLEVDIPWDGWIYVEQFLQVVYTFELALKMKRFGCTKFWLSKADGAWNRLDFMMVLAGGLDLWLMPAVASLQRLLGQTHQPSQIRGILKVLTLMRLARVLRLLKLLKMVKPLYRLLLGVMESFKAMQWVIVLTALTLYACAVAFTNLVGQGLVTEGNQTPKGYEYFGSVPRSLFSLFKLMNGDLSVVEPIENYLAGQLLFASFMVVTNWAVLAVLTSVVSDNMIAASQKANEEDEMKLKAEAHTDRVRRLRTLFAEIDRDGDGVISTGEWKLIMKDKGLHDELLDATGLDEEDLNDYFECLAQDTSHVEQARVAWEKTRCDDKELDYNAFIDTLKDEGQIADKRSVLHVRAQLRYLESRIFDLFHSCGVGSVNVVSQQLTT